MPSSPARRRAKRRQPRFLTAAECVQRRVDEAYEAVIWAHLRSKTTRIYANRERYRKIAQGYPYLLGEINRLVAKHEQLSQLV